MKIKLGCCGDEVDVESPKLPRYGDTSGLFAVPGQQFVDCTKCGLRWSLKWYQKTSEENFYAVFVECEKIKEGA